MQSIVPLALAGLTVLVRTAASISTSFYSPGNPILADGSLYSADPGPIVVNGSLYIFSGQDSAPEDVNAFIMNDWVLFSTSDPNPAGAQWTLEKNFEEPHALFAWASPGSAYASQIVQGKDGKFYLYCPVQVANTTAQDPFGIGVAVASNVRGPYKDHHPSGPIVSQTYPAPGNTIENIDPTVLVDDDGSVYMYWGTFGQLRGVKLAEDMASFASDIVTVTTLDGFFEASWLMKRNGVYYILYADNNVGPNSGCTPTVYHACIAYGTSSSPLGPWTYRGVILGIVSSTTSHPGAVAVGSQWYLTYHTADARNGGNFRRSLAYDKLYFDDTRSPPAIQPVRQTFRPSPAPVATYDRGQIAAVTGIPTCGVQYWVEAVHDLKTPANPLPPQYWSTYSGEQSVVGSTLIYQWQEAQTLNGTSVSFFADHPAGAVEGVAPPTEWHLEYQRSSDGAWVPVHNRTLYPLAASTSPSVVYFETISTRSVQVKFTAPTNGSHTAGIGVLEWRVLSTIKAIV